MIQGESIQRLHATECYKKMDLPKIAGFFTVPSLLFSRFWYSTKANSMQDYDSKPLIACVSTEADFIECVQNAVMSIGCDFYQSDDVVKANQDTFGRKISCVVFDYHSASGQNDPFVAHQSKDQWALIVAVPKGDVQASFRAAGLGAVNVIEKPLDENELKDNMRNALISEMRVQEFLSSEERRFSAPIFNCLTKREKAILRLLMDGESNKRVAAILDMGLRTVEGDRANTMKKLKVGSYVELIKLVTQVENDVLSTRKQFFCSGRPRKAVDESLEHKAA